MSKPYSFHTNNSVSHVEKDGSHIYIAQLVDEANQQHEKLEALNVFVADRDDEIDGLQELIEMSEHGRHCAAWRDSYYGDGVSIDEFCDCHKSELKEMKTRAALEGE